MIKQYSRRFSTATSKNIHFPQTLNKKVNSWKFAFSKTNSSFGWWCDIGLESVGIIEFKLNEN